MPVALCRFDSLKSQWEKMRTVQTGMSLIKTVRTKTIRKYCELLTEKFISQGISEPKQSAEYIIAYILGRKTLSGVNRSGLVPKEKLSWVDSLAQKRLRHMPLQYIVKEWDFRDLTLQLLPPVFIPRPETENLVSLALCDPQVLASRQFIEVGCGSGAICISLLRSLPSVCCTAVDCSEAACHLTYQNAQRYGVSDRLLILNETWNSDIVSKLRTSERNYDFLISNPPYIPAGDIQKLPPEISKYEDLRALCGGSDGLDVVREILAVTPQLVKQNGSIWLEVDLSHPPAIQHMLNGSDQIKYVQSHNDFTDRPRFCHLQILQ